MKKTFFLSLALAGIGLGAGFLNGLLGAGGGILIVFGLRRIFKNKVADGRCFYATALSVMLPLSLLSAFQYLQKGHLPADAAGVILLPALLGGLLGGILLHRLSIGFLSRIFAGIVLLSGVMLFL